MNLFESLRTALTALATNKLRAALTMLGIIIGVAAVIALSGIGRGVEVMIASSIEDIGSNLIMVMARQPQEGAAPVQLTVADAEALSDPLYAPAIRAVAPTIESAFRVTMADRSGRYTVRATTPGFAEARKIDVAIGGFIVPADVESGARVAVIGWEVYNELFPDGEYPIEQTIAIDGTRFTVVGVIEATGGMGGMGTNEDEVIYVPISTGHARLFPQRTLSGERPVSMIYVAAASAEETESAMRQIDSVLRHVRQIDASDEARWRVISQQQILDISSQITGVLTTFLAAIAAISLVVGGIGIMNIMLVTVTERTREIGIRKAVGAPSEAILVQFLIEAVVLTVTGGAIGTLLGVMGAVQVARIMDLTAEVTPAMVSLATGVAAGVGLVFGVYPAMRAAKLRPIEALRHE